MYQEGSIPWFERELINHARTPKIRVRRNFSVNDFIEQHGKGAVCGPVSAVNGLLYLGLIVNPEKELKDNFGYLQGRMMHFRELNDKLNEYYGKTAEITNKATFPKNLKRAFEEVYDGNSVMIFGGGAHAKLLYKLFMDSDKSPLKISAGVKDPMSRKGLVNLETLDVLVRSMVDPGSWFGEFITISRKV